MKILFVSALLPYPLLSGGQVRIYNLLKKLSEKHEITLLSFIRSPTETKYVKQLGFLRETHLVMRGKRYHPKYVLRSLTGKYPLLLTSYDNAEMRSLIGRQTRTGSYDLLHLEPFYVYPSVPEAGLPVVVSEHNVEHEVYRAFADRVSPGVLRPVLRREAAGIRKWETEVLQNASHVIAVSREDAATLAKIARDVPVTVVPNGVDSAYFRYSEKRFAGSPPRVLFTGNFHWIPNREALSRLVTVVWPAVKRRFPGAHLTIAGSLIPAWVRQPGRSDVSLHEKLPDIRDAFDDADVMIAPMTIAGGSKFKILEAMASGVPVITTTEGAAGLSVRDGEHLMIRDTTDGMMEALGKVSADARYRLGIMKAAKHLVSATYDWQHIAKLQEGVWKSVI